VLEGERGNAPLQSVFAIALFMLLAMGVVEVALVLYGRNIISAAAHEGARAAIELGQDPRAATTIATRTVKRSAGGLLEDVEVAVDVVELDGRSIVVVEVAGRLHAPGPIPFAPSVNARATATRETKLQ
jgi:Flp pilus assembly protein TadG